MAFFVEVTSSWFIHFFSVDVASVGCESFTEALSSFSNINPLRASLAWYFVDDICCGTFYRDDHHVKWWSQNFRWWSLMKPEGAWWSLMEPDGAWWSLLRGAHIWICFFLFSLKCSTYSQKLTWSISLVCHKLTEIIFSSFFPTILIFFNISIQAIYFR